MSKPTPLYLSDTKAGPPAGTFLFDTDGLSDGDAKELVFEKGTFQTRIFIQKMDFKIHVFENLCPHARTPLNLFGDNFLNLGGTKYLCRTHGAMFEIEDGRCMHGPCEGQYLRKVAVKAEGSKLYSL